MWAPSRMLLEDLAVIVEGKARVVVPKMEKFVRQDGLVEPSWAPVFYNPYMKDNRTLTCLLIETFSDLRHRVRTFVEPLAGACVRTVRVLLETGTDYGYACDINPLAIYLCRKNLCINGLQNRMTVEVNDANRMLIQLDREGIIIDAIDIDPFGSPVYYVLSAARALGKGGLLIMTATDLGALEGKYPEVARRRYGVYTRRTDYSKELAARVLAGTVARMLAIVDRGVRPIFTIYDRHYIKLAVYVEHNKKKALESLNKVGYFCVGEHGYPERHSRLPVGCSEMGIIGPIWLDSLWDDRVVQAIHAKLESLEVSGERVTPVTRSTLRKVDRILSELRVNAPFYYRLNKICSKLKRDVPSLERLIERLREMGFAASRTHFDPVGIRTTADFKTLLSLIAQA